MMLRISVTSHHLSCPTFTSYFDAKDGYMLVQISGKTRPHQNAKLCINSVTFWRKKMGRNAEDITHQGSNRTSVRAHLCKLVFACVSPVLNVDLSGVMNEG